ncbi:hypothetical protein [Klenkia sp. PcliD-1-E]|uniref:hypothetical protein n=1 Tax=Klenkia sp. PcliD-1-E TaxID=2954492 RepID=UPI0020985B49|nr:hypothetical protein [Klenkia sp. PcliD-1-E]MCO7221584.1 hypothetical protein [Klenkia sp. PcliD-1-E]
MFAGRPRARARVGLGAAALALCAGCGSADRPTDPAAAATSSAVAATSSAAAALSSAAQASPGAYGTPVDPGLPNPTSVATDSPAPAPTGATVDVVVTYADWDATTASIEAGAFVQGIVESGGTCTVTASRPGAAAVTASVPGEPDAGSTTCPGLLLSGGGLGSGSWSVVVDYSSATAQGRSTATTVVVP